jgi:hypothetical protein
VGFHSIQGHVGLLAVFQQMAAVFSEDFGSAAAHEPPVRQRTLAALGVAVIAGIFSALMAARDGATPDFAYLHTAAQLFLDGQNPYEVMSGELGTPRPFEQPLFYPFTAVLLVLPLTVFSAAIATGLFIGVCSGLLAWCITRDGLWRLHIFASAPFVMAATLGQVSPLPAPHAERRRARRDLDRAPDPDLAQRHARRGGQPGCHAPGGPHARDA